MDPAARLELIDAVVYEDCFDCAALIEEAHRGARLEVSREEMLDALENDSDLITAVTVRNGFACLSGREHLIPLRSERIRSSRKLRPRAELVARLVSRLPFVRGVALTGSLAADNAYPGADIDLLVICEGDRMGTVFLIAATLGRIAGRYLCANYYLAADHLAVAPSNIYQERELLQARPLTGMAGELWAANPWLKERFPNAEPRAGGRSGSSRAGGAVERLLGSRLGERLELWCRRVAERRLVAHHARFDEAVPDEVTRRFSQGQSLRFHGGGWDARITSEYERRREDLAKQL